MFENTSKKIKICAYLFFFGNLINLIFRVVHQWILLGTANSIVIELLFNTLNTVIMNFIIALFIYGFGKIVEHFENLKLYDGRNV